MNNRVTKAIIGKAIARTVALDITSTATFNGAVGEVFLADKWFNLQNGTTPTFADTDILYVGEVLDDSLDFNLPDGTNITAAKRILWSDGIEGARVSIYSGESYSAPVNEAWTVTTTAGFTPVVGQDYVLKIVYKHLRENPSQETRTYRVTAETATDTDLLDKIAAKINATDFAKVSAAVVGQVLTITGKDPDPNAGLDSIDEFYLVNFEPFLAYGDWEATALAQTAGPNTGQGDWRQVRDVEKLNKHDQRGAYNKTAFPVIEAPFRTVKGETYDTIVIEHMVQFTAPTNDLRQEPKTTLIYMPVSAGQTTNLLADLNAWMASVPGGFPNVTV